MIEGQKWSVILGIPWLTHYSPEINWKTKEIKMTRCLEECGKQGRSKQGKSGWQKQKKKERKKKREISEKKNRRRKQREVV